MVLLVSGAIAIILVLAFWAGYMQWRVRNMEKSQTQARQELEQKRLKKIDEANDSIQIVSRAYVQGQVETAEACLRLCGLMDQLNVPPEVRSEFVHIAKMADSIRHIPILSKWKSLPKAEKKDYRKYIEAKEMEFSTGVKEDINNLIGRRF